jgi:peptidase M28-like protein
MKRRDLLPLLLAGVVAACSRGSRAEPEPADAITPAAAMTLLSQLSDDSLRGRMTGGPGADKAAALIAREMERIGLEPAGDSGYFQRVPYVLRLVERQGRPPRLALRLAPSFAALDTVPPERRRLSVNVLGLLRGSDPTLRNEHVVVDAHYDHIGAADDPVNACTAVGADSICNGADDDASGTMAVLLVARAMARGPAPRRTIVFAAMTGEEIGLTGARWYVEHPTLPLDQMVANLEIEMIDRPDSLAGGPGKAWLTGYERSTMGDTLAAHGIPLVPDPRPTQQFFQRSDNYALAQRGIVAHTISTFNLHSDYHRPSDEASKADSLHMATLIEAIARATRLLADGQKPQWKPGGRPQP